MRLSPIGSCSRIFGARAINDVTMLKVLRDMGIEGITVHGFRSSFAGWAAEQTSVAKEIVEKALAHKVASAVEAAYRRTDFFDKRMTLIMRWASFLESRASARTACSARGPRSAFAAAFAERRESLTCRASGCQRQEVGL